MAPEAVAQRAEVKAVAVPVGQAAARWAVAKAAVLAVGAAEVLEVVPVAELEEEAPAAAQAAAQAEAVVARRPMAARCCRSSTS